MNNANSYVYTNKGESIVLTNVSASGIDFTGNDFVLTTTDSTGSGGWAPVPASPLLGGQPSPYSSDPSPFTVPDFKELLEKLNTKFQSNSFTTKYKDIKDFLKNSTSNERAIFLGDIISALKQLHLLKDIDMSSQGLLTEEGILSILVCLEGDAGKAFKQIDKNADEIGKVSKIEVAEDESKIKFK